MSQPTQQPGNPYGPGAVPRAPYTGHQPSPTPHGYPAGTGHPPYGYGAPPSYGFGPHGQPGPQQGPPPSNGWALAALIVGIVCLGLSPLPILNQAGILVGFVGVGLAVPAIVIGARRQVRTVMAFVALGLSILGLVSSFAFTDHYVRQIDAAFAPVTSGASGASDPVSPLASPSPAAPVVWTLEATSSGTRGIVTWNNGEGGVDQESPARMPWSRTIRIDPDRSQVGMNFSVSNYSTGSPSNDTTVTCRLSRNGQVVDEQTSRGMYANASCNVF